MDFSSKELDSLSSGLADVRQIPLSEIHPQSEDSLRRELHRIVSDASSQQVLIAAFNSSI
jgi:hypothetical protein